MVEKPVKLGETYEITITGLSHQGEGIGRANNFALFVPGAIPGEKVVVEVCEIKKNLAQGRLKKVVEAVPFRVDAPCAYFEQCGGCQLQHISYEKQLEFKRLQVKDVLTKIGGIDIDVEPTLGMNYPWRYRNKGHFHLDKVDGEVSVGFYEPGTYDFVPAKGSLLFSSVVNRLLSYLEEQLTFNEVSIYNRNTGKGYLRNIMIRESFITGEIMLILVTNTDDWLLNEVAQSVLAVFPQIKSLYQNINKSNKPVILGNKFKLINGQAFLQDKIGPYIFKISPQSFFQVNNAQAQILYEKALEYAQLSGKENVVDAYCGIGSIAIYLASKARHVIGIEVVEEAIKDAIENAKLNGIGNTEFIVGKAETWLPQWVKGGGKADVIVVDPPRKGCTPEVLEAIAEARPERVVYVSCNPATLARDLKHLVGNGYEVRAVQPVDLFPQTSHVETVVLMSRL
ncbi:MAG: 23S rRNA (uracil(1939)-C(5))-methyltransferase RlmD [Peptococcales bacterium]|jgi:23S rRNA (uracil1939-C5)-methyltransferase